MFDCGPATTYKLYKAGLRSNAGRSSFLYASPLRPRRRLPCVPAHPIRHVDRPGKRPERLWSDANNSANGEVVGRGTWAPSGTTSWPERIIPSAWAAHQERGGHVTEAASGHPLDGHRTGSQGGLRTELGDLGRDGRARPALFGFPSLSARHRGGLDSFRWRHQAV